MPFDKEIESEQVSRAQTRKWQTQAFHPESLTPRSVFFLPHLMTASLIKKHVLFHFLSCPSVPNTRLSAGGSSLQLLRTEAGREWIRVPSHGWYLCFRFRSLVCSPQQTSELLLTADLVIIKPCFLLRKTDLILQRRPRNPSYTFAWSWLLKTKGCFSWKKLIVEKIDLLLKNNEMN